MKFLGAGIALAAASSIGLLPAADSDRRGELETHARMNGRSIEMAAERQRPVAAQDAAPPPAPAPAPVSSKPRYERTIVVACAGNSVEGTRDTLCNSAFLACTTQGQTGPRMQVYRRKVTTPPEPWTYLGTTCQPEELTTPPADDLTAAIEQAFASTPLATPTASVQPPDGATLVNLPTYFQLIWPVTPGADGYAPGHTRTLTLLGQDVQLRIRAVSYSYDFGDGTRHGPTSSAGGPYPTGDITHTYLKTGTYTPTATALLAGEYRLADGPWQRITGTATRTTPLGPLDVLAIHPVLVPNRS